MALTRLYRFVSRLTRTLRNRGFARRGGATDKHAHGWGLAIYEGAGLRTFLDPLPAAQSPIAQLVEQYPIKTLNMMVRLL